MTATVETEGLTKFYGRHRGVADLNLLVEPGEVFGFLGPNGAGKTTTIRLLLDIIRPTSGRARILGLDTRSDGVEVRRRVGYLPAEWAFNSREPVLSLLRFLASVRGGTPEHRIAELADRLDLDLSRTLRALSTGNKRKVGLVQAFMHEPDLLILDEPTSGLDPLVQQEFLAMVREVRAAGRTVFMSSHVLAEVQQVADRVGIVRDGTLVTVEDVDALRSRALMRHVEIHFAEPVSAGEFTGLPDVADVQVAGSVLRCSVAGEPDGLVKAAARHRVTDLLSREPDLEQIFLTYYTEGNGDGAAVGAQGAVRRP